MINILIVDDSDTEIAILKSIFAPEKDFQVVGVAKNGKEALRLTESLKPNIITMDIAMPVMNGLDSIHLIMSQHPTPIVVISSQLNSESLNTTFLALQAGALSVLDKPHDINSLMFAKHRKIMIDTIRGMAEIKVIKRRFNTHKHKTITHSRTIEYQTGIYEIIGIGVSVGGPQVLNTILSKLPKDFPVPIVIVQHMTKGFITGFTKWLDNNTELHVKNAENDERLQAGTVYFAPDHFHLEIVRKKQGLTAKLTKGKPVSGFCPSATVLFKSIAKTCGMGAIGMILTGMGSDGAQGLFELKQANGHTLIQDQKSTVVFGMAGVAQAMGAVDKVVYLDEIAQYLIKMTKQDENI